MVCATCIVWVGELDIDHCIMENNLMAATEGLYVLLEKAHN